MHEKYTIKDSIRENRIFLNRSIVIFIAVILMATGLITRLIYLQVASHSHYANLAQDNRVKIEPLPPTRGIIYDRNGKILAENRPVFSLELIPEQLESVESTIYSLTELVEINDETVERFKKLQKRNRRFDSIPLKMHLNDEEVARFATHRTRFPGVDIHARLMRHYPYDSLTSHVVGYVGRINETELKSLDPAAYRGTYQIGKTGLEKTYEPLLHGAPGFEESEVNVQGRKINTLTHSLATPGNDLQLTLDIEMQRIAYKALGKKNGAVVAIDIETGGVLTFVSKPGFDPNLFVFGIDHKSYKELQSSLDRPLFNRALRGQYPPGSTVKPFIGLAGLRFGVISAEQKQFCPGFYQLPNREHRYRDWKKWGHGSINLDDAITQSCDVYFYDLATSLGIDKMHDYMDHFGFGKKTGIDITGEKRGILPSREWKRKVHNQPWFPGETVITGIGQGFSLVTPTQLAKATAIMAKKGQNVQPYLVEKVGFGNKARSIRQISENQAVPSPAKTSSMWTKIFKAMENVVHGPRGTAQSIGKDIAYKIAGKTGTAQVFSVGQEEEYNEEEIEERLRDHALFVAFAPASKPKIAVSVIVENGGHGGSVAAPVAGELIKYYLGNP